MRMTTIPVNGYVAVYKFDADDFIAYIGIHNLSLGPACGGCRVTSYLNEDEAFKDVLKLSKAMSYKNSLAGLNLGGGKMVVNSKKPVDDFLLENIGEAVNALVGDYVTGTDLGTSIEHMHKLKEYTDWVEDGKFGDTSIFTALGLYSSITALDLVVPSKKVKIYIEGLGKVGMELVKLLSNDGWYEIYVSDIVQSKVDNAKVLYNTIPYNNQSVDIYCPCAIGGTINYNFINKPNCLYICGGANNQLENDLLVKDLASIGVCYCPDYLVNAGGVMTLAAELEHWNKTQLTAQVLARGELLMAIMEVAEFVNMNMLTVANSIAEGRMYGKTWL